MKLKGEDVASSVREWVKEEIKKGPSSKNELGKFYFSVSTGTLALFATLLKFAIDKPKLDLATSVCFISLLLSSAIALYMAIPTVLRLDSQTELYSAHKKMIGSIVTLTGWWFALWLLGFAIGVVKLFS